MKSLSNKCCVEGCEKPAEFQVLAVLTFEAKQKGVWYRLPLRACQTHRDKIKVEADWAIIPMDLKSVRDDARSIASKGVLPQTVTMEEALAARERLNNK